MVVADFEAERTYDDDRFTPRPVFASEAAKVVFGYLKPGQFIPVHAPDSTVTVAVQSGRGVVRDGDDEHSVEPGQVVVVEAGDDRGVRAVDGRLELLLVAAPPPSTGDHGPVREGLHRGEFDPRASTE
jgi:quercetin dioxygenase-like cupin family protein